MANFGSRQIVRVRVALLDSTGAPDAGLENGYVSGNPISIQATPSIEAGDDFTVKNGAGEICMQYRGCDKIKGLDTVVTLCSMDPKMIALMTGGTILDTVADDEVGVMLPGLSDACPSPVSLEWWTIAQDGSAQGTLAGGAAYLHHVIPKSTFVPGAQTYENGILSVVLNGKGEENPNITTNGPFNDWPANFAEDAPDGLIGPGSWFAETSLPVAANDYVEVTSAAS